MTANVLFVCTANICRSPLMAYDFSHKLDESTGLVWRVESRGIAVPGPHSMCRTGATLIGDSMGGQLFARAHRSAKLVAEDLLDSTLILTAGLTERAAAAQLHPATRDRTFTMREAVILGAGEFTTAEIADARTACQSQGPVAAYAKLLNARRGVVPPLKAKWQAPWRQTDHPHEIRDVHGERGRAHRAGLIKTRAVTSEFRTQLERFIAAA